MTSPVHVDEDTLPWVEEYRTRGFVKLAGVFSKEEMDAARAEFDRLFDDPEILREDSLRSGVATIAD